MTNNINLTEALKKHFGFDKFKGDQQAIIQNLLDGNDTFVLMPTGGGKSLCYQLPSLLMDGTAIVISPLIALMKNQVDVISHLSAEDGVAHYLNSSLNKAAIDQVKADVRAGKTKLLYVAPESLTKEDNVELRIADYTSWKPSIPKDGDHIDSDLTIGQIVDAATAKANEKPDDNKKGWI